MSINISCETDEEPGIENYEEVIETVINKALDKINCPYETEVNVVLTDDDRIMEINDEFRGISDPTDVLSFPAIDFDSPGDFESLKTVFDEREAEFFNPDTGELVLGDMIISVNKIKSQAEEYGHSIRRELAFLVAHSMYHLFGYDHMTETDANVMEEKQEAVLKELGISRQ